MDIERYKKDYRTDGWPIYDTIEQAIMGEDDICKKLNQYEKEVSELRAYKMEAEAQEPFRLFVADRKYGSEDMYPGDSKLEYEHGVTVIPMYTRPIPSQQSECQEKLDFESLTDELHKLIINQNMGEHPSWHEIYEIIEKHYAGETA